MERVVEVGAVLVIVFTRTPDFTDGVKVFTGK
jgi:hypothetical protein